MRLHKAYKRADAQYLSGIISRRLYPRQSACKLQEWARRPVKFNESRRVGCVSGKVRNGIAECFERLAGFY
jgi:hypothetical protein